MKRERMACAERRESRARPDRLLDKLMIRRWPPVRAADYCSSSMSLSKLCIELLDCGVCGAVEVERNKSCCCS